MGSPAFVIGPSGSGKTYSIKNFKADEVGVISVEKGRLPFKSDIKVCKVKRDFAGAKGRVLWQKSLTTTYNQNAHDLCGRFLFIKNHLKRFWILLLYMHHETKNLCIFIDSLRDTGICGI